MLGRALSGLAILSASASALCGQIARRWTYPAGETPPMHLVFEPGGKLVFEAGFEYWNPARWVYDSGAGELRITIPKLRREAAAGIEYDVSAHRVKGYDPSTKTIVYQFGDTTTSLTLGGWVFFRDSTPPPPHR